MSREGEPTATWRPGDVVLGTYEVKQLLGEGGMGRVYRVLHRGWNMDLAAKVPHDEAWSDQTVGQFIREADTWVNLNPHPNVAMCFYVKRIGQVPVLFAELVDGGTLADSTSSGALYRDGQQRALRRIIDVAIQLAWALEHAHNEGLVHQDVKPANVLLTAAGTVKLTDFGIAAARSIAGAHATRAAQYGGMTPSFASPEQWAAARERASAHVTRRTDIWLWAVTVMAAFAGSVYWSMGPAAPDVLEALAADGSPEPNAPPIPAALLALLRRCLQTDAAQRPGDASELAAALASIHRDTFEEPYAREKPEASLFVADGLNNRAVSLIDLGATPSRPAELLGDAVRMDPLHAAATYNLGLLRWRLGEETDDALRAGLRTLSARAPDRAELPALEGLVECERAAAAPAVALLARAEERSPRERAPAPSVEALRAAVQRLGEGTRYAEVEEVGRVHDVALSDDGRVALWIAEMTDGEVVVRWDDLPTLLRGAPGSTGGRARLYPKGYGLDTHRMVASRDVACAVVHSTSGGVWSVRAYRRGRDVVTLPVTQPHAIAVSDAGRAAFATKKGVFSMDLLDPVATNRCIHGADVPTLDLDHSSEWLATGRDRTVDVWSVRTGGLLTRMHIPSGTVTWLAFAGEDLLAATSEGRVHAWRVGTWQRSREMRLPLARRPAVSRDGRLALAIVERTLSLWDLSVGRRLQAHPCGSDRGTGPWAGPDQTYGAALSGDGKRALSSSGRSSFAIWSLHPGVPAPYEIARPDAAMGRSVTRSIARCRELLTSGRTEEAILVTRALRSESGQERSSEWCALWEDIARQARRTSLHDLWPERTLEVGAHEAFSLWPDGSRLAVCRKFSWGQENVSLWSIETGAVERSFAASRPIPGTSLFTLELTDRDRSEVAVVDGPRLSLSGESLMHRMRSFDGPAKIASLPGGASVQAATVDGRLLLVAGKTRGLAVYDTSRRVILAHLPRRIGRGISEGGRRAITLAPHGEVEVWSLIERRLETTYDLEGCFGMTPDGTRVGGFDGVCVVGRPATRFGAVDGTVCSGALARDGRLLVLGTTRGELHLVDGPTGRLLRSVTCPGGAVHVALARDLSRLVAVTAEQVMVWRLEWELDCPRDEWDDAARCIVAPYVGARLSTGAGDVESTSFAGLMEDLRRSGFGFMSESSVQRGASLVEEDLRRRAVSTGGPALDGIARVQLSEDDGKLLVSTIKRGSHIIQLDDLSGVWIDDGYDGRLVTDSKWMLGRTRHGLLKRWNAETGAPEKPLWGTLEERAVTLTGLHVLIDGKFAADRKVVVSSSSGIRLWNAWDGRLEGERVAPDLVALDVRSSELGPWSMLVRDGDTLSVWDPRALTKVRELSRGDRWDVARTSLDGALAAAAGSAGLAIWEIGTGAVVDQIACEPGAEWTSLALHPTEPYLLAGTARGALVVWDLRSRTASTRVRLGAPLRAVEVAQGGQFVVVGGEDGHLRLFHWETGASVNFAFAEGVWVAVTDGGCATVSHVWAWGSLAPAHGATARDDAAGQRESAEQVRAALARVRSKAASRLVPGG